MPRLTVIKSKTILISTLYFDSFFFLSPLDIYEIFTSIVGVHSKPFLRIDLICFFFLPSFFSVNIP